MPLSQIVICLNAALLQRLAAYTDQEIGLAEVIKTALVDYVDLRTALESRYDATVAALCAHGGPSQGGTTHGPDGHHPEVGANRSHDSHDQGGSRAASRV